MEKLRESKDSSSECVRANSSVYLYGWKCVVKTDLSVSTTSAKSVLANVLNLGLHPESAESVIVRTASGETWLGRPLVETASMIWQTRGRL